MTHKDIYTKFMIEYDKANVTSSYPSLTEYEVAVVLDKAYYALIAQKVTGNNVRNVGFEQDVKVTEDLSPLVTSTDLTIKSTVPQIAPNVVKYKMPDHLYFISGYLKKTYSSTENDGPMDGNLTRNVPVQLVTHNMAQKFFSTAYNMPWIKNPVCYIEGEIGGDGKVNNEIYVVYDPYDSPDLNKMHVVYIKKPNPFVKALPLDVNTYVSFFDPGTNDAKLYQFELSDTVAEELISLAVTFALENVQSPRLNSKINMRGLEA